MVLKENIMDLTKPQSKTVFVKIEEGTTVKDMYGGQLRNINIPRDCICKIAAKNSSDIRYWGSLLWEKISDNETLVFVGSRPHIANVDDLEIIKMPTLDKARRGILVKDSIWEANQDMYAEITEDDGTKFFFKEPQLQFIQTGTQVQVVNPKGQTSNLMSGDVCCIVKFLNTDIQYLMPMRFFGGMDCIKEGKEKTYWKMYNQRGELVREKRYKTLTALKGAINIICGNFDHDFYAKTDDDKPWFIDGAAAAPGYTSGETPTESFSGWYAVEYAAKDDSENKELI